MVSGSKSSSGWLSGIWDSLERDEKKMVIHFGLGIITIYISFKAQQYLMSALTNPQYAKQKAQALGILQSGFRTFVLCSGISDYHFAKMILSRFW